MYVCLCSGTTCEMVADAIANGASNCRQVAVACGAGLDCGGCLRNLKALVDRHSVDSPDSRTALAGTIAG